MKSILNILLAKNKQIFAEFASINIEPHALSTNRKFVFKNVKFKQQLDIQYGDLLKINIYYFSIYTKRKLLYTLKILVRDLKYLPTSEKDWWVYGLVFTQDEYNQGIIDVFDSWQRMPSINWLQLPTTTISKEAYITACLQYTGLSTKIIEKQLYQLDMAVIRDENDFLYWIAVEFLGDRGYMGHSLHTLDDCFLVIFQHQGYFYDKKIHFINTKHLSNDVIDIFESVKNIFLKYRFALIVT